MAGLTEKEACGLVCPTQSTGRCICYCVAANCMAWRTSQQGIKEGYIEIDPSNSKNDREVPPQPELGFCGLAGWPNF